MVLAQFTGIGLQKDDNAFILYNKSTGAYNDNTTVAQDQKPLHINSRAIYKPDYYSTHVKVSNGAVLQCVSIFAIGFSQHFVADTGGDQSITNSNSNFGAKALIARKFSNIAFERNNSGYITHIIPPKEVTSVDESVFWVPLDIGITTSYSAANSNARDRLYAFGYSDFDAPPTHIIDSFRIGSKVNDVIKLDINNNIESAFITMEGSLTATNEKISYVAKNQIGTANSITDSDGSIFGLTGSHEFSTGESVRIFSDDGILPDGIKDNQIYFVIEGTVNGLNNDQIKLAKTLNETISGNINAISNVNTIGGSLRIVSRVSDKLPGDFGHPIQYDDSASNWYINVKGDSSNTIYDAISSLEKVVTSKAFILRKPDNRNLEDRIYKVRYVIPKEFQNAKPPSAGYVFQESSTTIASSQSEYSGNITNTVNHRNIKIVHNIDYNSNAGIATITSELPHKLRPGSSVKLKKIKSENNITAADKRGFNGIFAVANVIDTKSFTINIPSSRDPGNFIAVRPNLVTQRDENQPNFSINEYSEVFYTYRVNILRDYIENFQDGIYHLTCLRGSINPTSNYFNDFGYSQNVVNLYPQLDRDNYSMDPKSAISIAKNDPISEVITDDLRNSITKEFVNDLLLDNRLAYKVENIEYSQLTGIATVTSDIQHNLNSVIRVSIASSGEGYGYAGAGSTTIYNAKLNGGSGEGATIRFTVDDAATYNMSNVVIVDGGAGYSVGETLTVSPVGIPTYSGGGINYSGASVTIEAVNLGSKNSIQVENVVDYGVNADDFNGVYKITDIPSSKKVSFLLGANNTGIGTYKRGGTFAIAGAATTVADLKHTDINTGIVTITTATPHGLNLGNKFKLDYNEVSFSSTDVYNGTYTVNERVGLNTFTFFIGDNVPIATIPSSVGNVLMTGYSSQESDTDSGRENIEKRMNPLYVGITTTLNGALTKTSTSITLSNSDGFIKGDYLQIGPEVFRIKEDFTNNSADIIRGVFSTKVSAHEDGSLIKKISPLPVESRRYSILRASGHTFEYVGFGHGNYSTSLPQRQDRVLNQDEQLLSQSEKSDGGVVVYTGMNDTGDFYVGNRRLSSATGQEQTIGIPVPTFVGDDAGGSRLSVVFDDITIRESIKVEGGAGGVIQSEFNGPVVFNEKVTQTSNKGADFKVITLKGTDTKNLRRKQTVGINTPFDDGDNGIGDIVWKNEPKPGGYLGWVYSDEKWRKFGLIATERASDGDFADSNDESPLGNFTILPSKIGINTNFPRDLIDVQAGLSRFDQLYVAGIATFNETVTLGKVNVDDLDVLNSLNVSGTVSINANGGLGVTFSYATIGVGATSFTSGIGLTVNSNTSVSGYLGISSSVSVGQELTVTGNTDLNGTLDVSGNTSIGGDLEVTNATDLNGDLDVSGNTSLGGILTVTSATDLNDTLTVCGATTLSSTLTVENNTDLNGTLTVSGDTTLSSTLTVENNTDLNGTLDVCGNTSLGGTLYVSGNTDIDGTLDISGNTSIGGTLEVTNATDLNGTLDVGGNTSVGGNTFIGGTLEVTNATDLNATLDVSGNTSLGGTLKVDNATDLNGTLDVSGNTSLGGTLKVTNATDLDGRLDVSGTTCLGGNLTVKGLASFDNDITVCGNTLYTGSLSVSGNTSLGGTLKVDNATDLNRTLDVSGNTSIGGTLKVTNAADLNDNLTVNKNITTCTLTVNNKLTGSNAVFTGTVSANNLDANNNITANTLTVNNAATISTLTVNGNATINNNTTTNTLTVNNAATISTLTVNGNTSTNTLDVNGNLTGTNAQFTGTVSANNLDANNNTNTNTLTVNNAATISTLTVNGNISTNTLDINNKLTGTNADFTGTVSVNNLDANNNITTNTLTVDQSATISTLTVNGNTTLNTLTINDGATINGPLNIADDLVFTGSNPNLTGTNAQFTGTISTNNLDANDNITTNTLTVTKSATISTLTVSNNTNTNSLTVNNAATISTLTVNGGATISSLTVRKSATISSNLTVGGETQVNLKNYGEIVQSVGTSTNSIPVKNGNYIIATCTNGQSISFSTADAPVGAGKIMSITLQLTYSGTVISPVWATNITWSGGSVPDVTGTSGKSDIFTFISYNNGSNWYGILSIYNL